MREQITLPAGVRHIHCVGIGGVGVSALVPELLKRGYTVSGSDPARHEAVERLKTLGVKIAHVHDEHNIEHADLIVATAAVKPNHIELAAGAKRGIPVWHRAKMLAYLLQDKKSILVTGAHGKTTLTAMIAHVLKEMGMDPSVYAGGEIPAIGSNAYSGTGAWAVAEGDESDGSFTCFQPDIAVINNIDRDHLDHYHTMDAIFEGFEAFLAKTEKGGWVVLSADCPYTHRLRNRFTGRNYLSYGFSPAADIRGMEYCLDGTGWRCDVVIAQDTRCIQEVLRMPVYGRMNYHNALGALAVGCAMEIPLKEALRALSTFSGVKRRMEFKGKLRGIRVYDDYAHHPAEIQATVGAFRDQSPGRLIVIFQPHLYSRTQLLLDEFGGSFAGVDLAVITDIYAAREAPLPGVSGEIVVNALRKNHVPAVYLPDPDEIPAYLQRVLREGDTVVTMGAGDIWKSGEAYLGMTGGKHG